MLFKDTSFGTGLRPRDSSQLNSPSMREGKVSVELSRVRVERETAHRQKEFGIAAYCPIDFDEPQSRERALNAWFFKHQSSCGPSWSSEARGGEQNQVLLDHACHALFQAAPASYTACLNDVLKKIESNWSDSAKKTLEFEHGDKFWTSTRSEDNEQRCIDHQ